MILFRERQMSNNTIHNNPYYMHYSKNKQEAIQSWGLITYTMDADGELLFLIYQRRDTYEYMELIRSIWSKANVPRLFHRMSLPELQRVREYIHEELWDDIFVNKEYKTYKESAKAREKYNSIRQFIPVYLDASTSTMLEPPWGFPKGKKNGHQEENIACARREFEEETCFSTESFVIHDFSTKEEFIGSNNRPYASTYYLAYSPECIKPIYKDTGNPIRPTTISEEAADVKWLTVDAAIALLDERKIEILREAVKYIHTHKN